MKYDATCTLTLTDEDRHSLTLTFGDGRPPRITVDGHSLGFTFTPRTARMLGEYLVSECGTDAERAKEKS